MILPSVSLSFVPSFAFCNTAAEPTVRGEQRADWDTMIRLDERLQRGGTARTVQAASWPTQRLIEIWNSLPGVAPVNKFTDRKTAGIRIWKAMQSLGETVTAEPASEVEPAVVQAASQEAPAAVPQEAQADAPADEIVGNASAQAPDVAPVTAAAAITKPPARQKHPRAERSPRLRARAARQTG
jgi:hypothetical protein